MLQKKTLCTAIMLAIAGVQAHAACPTYTATTVSNETCRTNLSTTGTPLVITGTTFNNANSTDSMPFKAIATTLLGLQATVNGVTALYTQAPNILDDVNLSNTPISNMLFDSYSESQAAGPVTVDMSGTNQITNGYAEGDATLFLRAQQGSSTLNLAANSRLTIDNAGKRGASNSTEDIAWGDSSEGLYLYANLLGGTQTGDVSLSMDPTTVLDIASLGTGILADISADGQGQGNIDIDLNSQTKIKSTLFTSGSVQLGALAARQTLPTNTGSITLVSQGELTFTHGNGGKGGGAVYVDHAGNSLTAAQTAIDIQLTGANSKQIVSGDDSAGVRAWAMSGDVKIIADVDNKMYLDKDRVSGINFGDMIFNAPFESKYNPADVTIENKGLIQIAGGIISNYGLMSLTNDSDTTLKNAGTIVFRDNSSGTGIRLMNNYDGTADPTVAPSPIVGKTATIENSGTIAFLGSGVQMTGIHAFTAKRGEARVTNSGNIYTNRAAIMVSAAKSDVVNTATGTVVSYFSLDPVADSFEDTLLNQGTWIAKDALDFDLVTFDFGSGTALAPNTFENTGLFAVAGTAVANAVAIPVSSDLNPAVTGDIKVSPTEAAATELLFKMGGTGNGAFKFGGTVDFKNATATEQNYNLWTLDSDLNANGGNWLVDVKLAGDASLSDEGDSLVVEGSVTTTKPIVVKVTNANGVGELTKDGIELVSIVGNSPGTEFSLNGGSVTQNGYKYRLLRRPFAADGAVTGATWFLANIHCEIDPPATDGSIAIACTGLDKGETVKVPGGTCTSVNTTSPALANCTTDFDAVPLGGSVVVSDENGNVVGSYQIRGLGGTAVPSLNWAALLGLFMLVACLSGRQRKIQSLWCRK